MLLFWYLCSFFCCFVWLIGLLMWKHAQQLPCLSQMLPQPRESWPSLTILVPARNEADTLPQSIRQRMTTNYPNLQVIIVNDRSEDQTGPIAETLAQADSRIQVIHIRELPTGWLGKQHALYTGVQHATGEWILFSDADVEIHPDVLGKVIDHCETHQFDVLAALPTFCPNHALLGGLYALMFRMLYAITSVKSVENPRSKMGIGVGAFTLVRRNTLLDSPGFPALRMRVDDDLQLGLMLKRSGARCTAINGAGEITVALYRTIRDFVVGAEKNAWAVSAHFNLFRGLFISCTFFFLDLAPWLLTILAPSPFSSFGGATLGFLLLTSCLALHFNRSIVWHGPLAPLGAILFFFASLRGTLLGWWRGGLFWRNTFYPTSSFLQTPPVSVVSTSSPNPQSPQGER